MANPLLGIFFHATGGFAAGSFYLPIKKIEKWSWESAWLTNGLFAWLIVPIAVSLITVPNTIGILVATPTSSVFWTFFFGMLWGIGGLTFGMAMRYLGISLGMALALGITAAFGTLLPPIYDGKFGELISSSSGKWVLLGVGICLVGIGICGRAGLLKDKELSSVQKSEGVKEFNLGKGIVVALFAGVLSACFAYGIVAGKPISEAAVLDGAPNLWQNGPVFVVILLGGLFSNLVWCLRLNFKSRSYRDYINGSTPLLKNYAFAALAGTTWYCQFMFYGMGSTQMGAHDFASWTLHMAFIILFSTFWGLVTKEWASTSKKTKLVLALGLLVLLFSTIVIGLSEQLVQLFNSAGRTSI